MSIDSDHLLLIVPKNLREELWEEFNKLLRNYRESKWEPTELDGGRLCEIIYSIIDGYTKGTFPTKSTKPQNFVDSCKNLEKVDQTKFCRSIRVQIPRVMMPLYEFRNNRGVGHVGGDVNSNHMDSTYVVHASKWLIAELIRIFHQVTTDEAASAVELIVQRETQLVWDIGEIKRVLKKGLDYKGKTLLLLYSCITGHATDRQLFEWVEYSKKATYKTNVLKKLHDERLIEYSQSTGNVKISPLGISWVENNIQT